MSHSLDQITGTKIKDELSNKNEAVMSCLKALSSYWPGHTEKDYHDPFRVKGMSPKRIQSITVTQTCTQHACKIPVFL